MSTENYQNVKAAYSFFQANINQEIYLADIAKAAGWKESSVSTYFNKKWKDLIVERVDRGVYRVCMPSGMSLEEFGKLHTQIDEHLR